jgi:hypothetical protein
MAAAQYGNHPVNLLRREVAAWRQASYGEDRGRGWLLLTGELCLDALRANFILT